MRFMLDTNIIAYAKSKRPESVAARLQQYDPLDICISAITMAELEYGASKSSWPEKNRVLLMLFLSEIQVVPFDANAAREYGDIRADLEKRGLIIGGNDMLIAAHAKSLNFTLITNNQREFERVKGLKLENWL